MIIHKHFTHMALIIQRKKRSVLHEIWLANEQVRKLPQGGNTKLVIFLNWVYFWSGILYYWSPFPPRMCLLIYVMFNSVRNNVSAKCISLQWLRPFPVVRRKAYHSTQLPTTAEPIHHQTYINNYSFTHAVCGVYSSTHYSFIYHYSCS